jgi:hypothetical protein
MITSGCNVELTGFARSSIPEKRCIGRVAVLKVKKF